MLHLSTLCAGGLEQWVTDGSVPDELAEYQLISSRGVRRLVGGISRRTLSKWIKAGIIPAPKLIGGENRWRASVIREWLETHLGAIEQEKRAA